MTIKQPVEVCMMDFATLCSNGATLQLDHYQRPYVWDRHKVNQLLEDLDEFRHNGNGQKVYYLGTLLLHRNDEKKARFVIDGQQRLSTLAVLYHALHNELPKGLEFHYRSPISARNLRVARKLMSEHRESALEPSIVEQLCFTVITVEREDLAFTFFDTQNFRGVPLKATDLLKAYHLRAVNGPNAQHVESLQQICARRWEHVQMAGPRRQDCEQQDFAPELFQYYLWRARNWRGNKQMEREDHDSLLEAFQQQSVGGGEIDEIPLYPGYHNQFANSLKLQSSDDYRLALNPLQISGSAANLPFTLRQPIHKGICFFLYVQKYASLLDDLLYKENTCHELEAFREFYRRVVRANAYYLQELFNLALLMYVDRFGYQHLLAFAVGLELVLGGLRLEKSYIFKESPLKYLRDAPYNLLDEICGAYRPQEVMTFLRSEIERSKGYGKAVSIVLSKGVQGRYLNALLDYFNLDGIPEGDSWVLKRWLGMEK